MLLSRIQNAGQNYKKIAGRSFENVAKFSYLGMTLMILTLIQKGITRRLNSGNACCSSGQSLLFPCLLLRNVIIRL
jgi:hypothetical protein